MRVMTFNLRNCNAADRQHAWENRRDLVIDTLRAANPDLLGVQESLPPQIDLLRERLSDYAHLGVCRDDGDRKGEACTVIVKRDRFDILDSGTFWLSETPHDIASKGWDAQLPRIATWAHLRHRTTTRELVVLNTHFDHKGETARVESAKLLRSWLIGKFPILPTIITGDFNAADQTPEYAALVQGNLFDVWRFRHPRLIAEEGTYHAFTGTRTRERIDWILCTSDFTVEDCKVDYTSRGALWPSDHFPLIADLSLGK